MYFHHSGRAVAESQDPTSPSPQRNQTITGLLECRKKDESKLIKHLITGQQHSLQLDFIYYLRLTDRTECVCLADVRTESVLSSSPGLAARVLFLCVRQADCSGDQARVKGLCSVVVSGIKTALKVKEKLLCLLSFKHLNIQGNLNKDSLPNVEHLLLFYSLSRRPQFSGLFLFSRTVKMTY